MKMFRLFVAFTLMCFALCPATHAVVPPPDGGYANFTTAEGTNALLNLTSGAANTGLGWSSLLNVTTGSFNTGVGAGTLVLNSGHSNTGIGTAALLLNTTGTQNTALGTTALEFNDSGNENTAVGVQALFSNTTASANTATGVQALFRNTTGTYNTGIGLQALFSNTVGGENTATGSQALLSNTSGVENTATGDSALVDNNSGNFNTATGDGALADNTSGSNNIALGYLAGQSLTTGDYNIDIGNVGVSGEGHTIRIGDDTHQGATYMAAVYGVSVAGLTVVMDSSDRLGTLASSRRFKQDIKPIERASQTILALKPVTFRYKKEIDPAGTPQFGLVAEEVEKVNPDLVVRDKEGKPYSVRYDAVNAMLLNEFLKEHSKVEKLEATSVRQQQQIEALTAGLQKVSVRLELSKPAPQTVSKSH